MKNIDNMIWEMVTEDYHQRDKRAKLFNKRPDETRISAIVWSLNNWFIETPKAIHKMLWRKSYWDRIKQAIKWESHIDYEFMWSDYESYLWLTTREVCNIFLTKITNDKYLTEDIAELRDVAASLWESDDSFTTPWFDWFKATAEERVKENATRTKKRTALKKKFFDLLEKHIWVIVY